MKAFIGHSFDDKDKTLVDAIISFLSKRGIVCLTGEKAENKSVSEKVKERIDKGIIFLGIFTIDKEIYQPKPSAITPLNSLLIKLRIRKLPEDLLQKIPPIFTTSNWVIQESGYAIGKSKEIILLVEEGVYKFPELQGDKEIIYFKRNSLEPALLRLSEIIQNIQLPTKLIGQGISQEIPEIPVDDGIGEQEKSKELPWDEFLEARDNGDTEKAESIYQDKIRKGIKKEYLLFWDANICGMKYRSGDAGALIELSKMAEATKDYDVNKQLGYCYDFGGMHDQARKQFTRCVDLAKDIPEKIDCFIDISASYVQENNFNLAIDTLLDVINNHDFDAHLEKIFLKLVEIAKTKEDDYLYVMFAEKALNINQVNTSLRFNLGHKYLKMEKNDLAVYHYKKLLTMQETSGSFNNIAVGYAGLDMKAKEALSFERAVDKKDDTLSYANLAQKYLDEGFTNVADGLLKKADELGGQKVEVSDRVGYAKSRSKKILEDEDKKEKEILAIAEKLQKFRVRHADAYCSKNTALDISAISGIWITEKWGELKLDFNMANKTFIGSSQTKIEGHAYGRALLGYFSGLTTDATKEYKIRKVEISGTIYNLSGSYTIKVTEEKETTSPPIASPRTLLSLPSADEVYSASGLLIINNSTSIDVLEEDAKNNRLFSHWNKK